LAIKPDWYVPAEYERIGCLTPEEKDNLRMEYQQPKATLPKLAKKYNISTSYASNIINYKR